MIWCSKKAIYNISDQKSQVRNLLQNKNQLTSARIIIINKQRKSPNIQHWSNTYCLLLM